MHAAQLLIVLVWACTGCSRATPSGFWPGYKAALIVGQHSDQGPWGGTRWIQWVAKPPARFTMADAVTFAKSHGWKCAPPVTYTAGQLRVWQFMDKPVFPLHFGPADRAPDDRSVEEFPRHIDGESLVSECDSGWIRVPPGSGKSETAFGYIQVEVTGARMAVYHLWGDS